MFIRKYTGKVVSITEHFSPARAVKTGISPTTGLPTWDTVSDSLGWFVRLEGSSAFRVGDAEPLGLSVGDELTITLEKQP